MKNVNIIGDIHGRTNWKQLVRPDCINVFVGDYFAPYNHIIFDDQVSVFLDILKFKEEHPETVLLIGNHDEDHWHIRERYSRFDSRHVREISELFEENKELFQMAYATADNKVLITHAGVSIVWYIKYKFHKSVSLIDLTHDEPDEIESPINHNILHIDNAFKPSQYNTIEEVISAYNEVRCMFMNKHPKDGYLYFWKDKFYLYDADKFVEIKVTPKELAEFINNLWLSGKYIAFNFANNSSRSDCYGDSIQQSPVWIRPDALEYANIFAGGDAIQIVGHTQFDHPTSYINKMSRFIEGSVNIDTLDHDSKIAFVDCLGFNTESLIYDGNNLTINNNKTN